MANSFNQSMEKLGFWPPDAMQQMLSSIETLKASIYSVQPIFPAISTLQSILTDINAIKPLHINSLNVLLTTTVSNIGMLKWKNSIIGTVNNSYLAESEKKEFINKFEAETAEQRPKINIQTILTVISILLSVLQMCQNHIDKTEDNKIVIAARNKTNELIEEQNRILRMSLDEILKISSDAKSTD